MTSASNVNKGKVYFGVHINILESQNVDGKLGDISYKRAASSRPFITHYFRK